MTQTCYEYYCEHLQRNIGMGFRCFDCKHFKRATDPGKKCQHEKVTRTYTREV